MLLRVCGMVHRRGSRIEAEWLIEAIGKFLDDSHQGFVRAITEQMLDCVVPDIAANRTGQNIVERMVEERLSHCLEVAQVA